MSVISLSIPAKRKLSITLVGLTLAAAVALSPR